MYKNQFLNELFPTREVKTDVKDTIIISFLKEMRAINQNLI